MNSEDYKLRFECAADLMHVIIRESNEKNDIISHLKTEVRQLREQLATINSLQSEEKSGIMQEERFNPNHDEKGRFASGNGASGTKYAPSPRRNSGGITVKPKTYAMLCGEFNTRYPMTEDNHIVTGRVVHGKYVYLAKRDEFGSLTILSKIKI